MTLEELRENANKERESRETVQTQYWGLRRRRVACRNAAIKSRLIWKPRSET